MQKNKISLVGTTQGGRNFEVERLLDSLIGTTDFLEIVFVDQSGSKKTKDIVEKYNKKVNIKYLESEKVSLSKARNLALKEVSGNVIGFCDDDAYYDYYSLSKLSELKFKQNQIISVAVVDKKSGGMYGGRGFPKRSKKISFLEIIRYSISVGTFIFLYEPSKKIIFDERLGAGTYLGGSEETELFFRLKSQDFITRYNSDIVVYHDNDPPVDTSSADLSSKYYKYALGYGVVLRSFLLESRLTLLIEVLNITIRCVLGAFLKKNRMLYVHRLRGFLKGLIFEGRLK